MVPPWCVTVTPQLVFFRVVRDDNPFALLPIKRKKKFIEMEILFPYDLTALLHEESESTIAGIMTSIIFDDSLCTLC